MGNVSLIRMRGKGQITLPAEFREELQLKEGSELIAISAGNELVLTPKIENPLENAGMLGRARGFTRVKDLIWKYERQPK